MLKAKQLIYRAMAISYLIALITAGALYYFGERERVKYWDSVRMNSTSNMIIDFARLKAEKLEIIIDVLLGDIKDEPKLFSADILNVPPTHTFIVSEHIPTKAMIAESDLLREKIHKLTNASSGLLFSSYAITNTDRNACLSVTTPLSQISYVEHCELVLSKNKTMSGWSVDKINNSPYLTYRKGIIDQETGFIKAYFWASFTADVLFSSLSDLPYSISSKLLSLQVIQEDREMSSENIINIPMNLLDTLQVKVVMQHYDDAAIGNTIRFFLGSFLISAICIAAILYIRPINIACENALRWITTTPIRRDKSEPKTHEEKQLIDHFKNIEEKWNEAIALSVWVNSKKRSEWTPANPELLSIQKRLINKESESKLQANNSKRLGQENKRYHAERSRMMGALMRLKSKFEIEMSHFLQDNVFDELTRLNFDLQEIDLSLTQKGDSAHAEMIHHAENRVSNINHGVYNRIQHISVPRLLSYDLSDKISQFEGTRYELRSKRTHASFNIENYSYSEPEIHAINGLISNTIKFINTHSQTESDLEVFVEHQVSQSDDGRHLNALMIEAPMFKTSQEQSDVYRSEFEVEEIASYARSIDMEFSFTTAPSLKIIAVYRQTNFHNELPDH